MSWIVDCSVAISWCFEDEANSRTEAMLDRLQIEPAVVPQDHWSTCGEMTQVSCEVSGSQGATSIPKSKPITSRNCCSHHRRHSDSLTMH